MKISAVYLLLPVLFVLSSLFSGCSGKAPPEEPVDYENIQQAASHGDMVAVKSFLDEGVPVNHLGTSGTPLHNAVRNGHAELVEFLLARGADSSIRQPRFLSDETPLHTAAGNGDYRIVALLVRHGADVNAEKSLGNISGLTPLHEAVLSRQVHEGHLKVVSFLLENGADVNAKALMGEQSGTPLKAAAERGQTEIADILRRHGGKE